MRSPKDQRLDAPDESEAPWPGRRRNHRLEADSDDDDHETGQIIQLGPRDRGPHPLREPIRWKTLPDGQEVAALFDESLLESEAVKVISRLNRFGHVAYLVGGCVRDLLLGRIPKDFDIATSARPSQVRRLFRNCRIIGRRFKLAHILFGEKVVEVSTFRALPQDQEANGDELLITRDNEFGTPEEDAVRRDFTINGLFYDLEAREVIDHTEGVADIRSRVLRTIGDPDLRMQEDPVRILRAVKFAARLDLSIDPPTLEAMRRHRFDIQKCAVPRVTEEVARLLNSGSAYPALRMLRQTDALEVVLPEVADYLDRLEQRGDSVAFERFWTFLRCLDILRNRRGPLPNYLLFATIFADLVVEAITAGAEPEEMLGRDWGTLAGHELRPIAVRMNQSRQDTDRIRQMIAAQRRFFYPGKRRTSTASFMRRPYFKDAFQIFRFYAAADPGLREDEERWCERLKSMPKQGSPPPFREGGGRGKKRARRNRRGDRPRHRR